MNYPYATSRRVKRQRRPNHKGSRMGFAGMAPPRPERTKSLKARPAGWNAAVAWERAKIRLDRQIERIEMRRLGFRRWLLVKEQIDALGPKPALKSEG